MCDLKVHSKGDLEQHMTSVHEGEKWSCVQCDEYFAYENELNDH